MTRPRAQVVLVAAAAALATTPAGAGASPVPITKATCAAGDKLTETALQGQVPWLDRLSGRAADGYHCNLSLIGRTGDVSDDLAESQIHGWANFDTYETCAYFGDGNDTGNGDGGTVVMDVSDPAHPKQTAYLTTSAMQGPWESLRVNAARGLLVADHQSTSLISAQNPSVNLGGDPPGTSPLDVYDVSQDCAHPKLLASVVLPNGVGHESWFQPDGMGYYVSGGGRVVPVDLSDPAHPKELGVLRDVVAHGGSVSDDGRRGYFCTGNAVAIWTTAQVAERRSHPEVTEVSAIDLPAAGACQETYPVTYQGHPYLLQFGEQGEYSGGNCDSVRNSNFARINFVDIADERRPKLVATLMNEVAQPANCSAIAADKAVTNNPNGSTLEEAFLYGAHMCHPDRLHDPTILACAEWFSGVRVYD